MSRLLGPKKIEEELKLLRMPAAHFIVARRPQRKKKNPGTGLTIRKNRDYRTTGLPIATAAPTCPAPWMATLTILSNNSSNQRTRTLKPANEKTETI